MFRFGAGAGRTIGDGARRAKGLLGQARASGPGLALTILIAVSAVWVREGSGLPALNPVVVALAVGLALGTVTGLPEVLRPGVAFAVRPMLRAAIVLLGLQVTLGGLISLGAPALLLAVAVVALTLPFTVWLGHVLGVDRGLSTLIGTGTAICGASAIVAASQVTRGRDEDVAYALAVITLCGTAAMLLFPFLAPTLGLGAHGYGLWVGASVHEVVQAVGAAAAGGEQAAQSGTVMKLARVFLLAPAVVALGWWAAHDAGNTGAGRAKVAVPWFAFGFLLLVALGSTGWVPEAAVGASRQLVPLMLAASVAGLGLSTNLRALRAQGVAPLVLGAASSAFIAVLAYLGVHFLT